ncbi:MAG: type IV pilin, partial [Methanobacteriota archaeon]
MRSVIQKDEAAVSPVIATILMVAITVVLAAVLYVMVSGLITP